MRYVGNIFMFALLGVLVYFFQPQLKQTYAILHDRVYPCSSPIVYTIGTFDSRFGISKEKFLADIVKGESLWESAANRDLFVYATSTDDPSALKINLVYDYRQAATARMNEIGMSVENSKASYDSLRAKYISEKSKLDAAKAKFDSDNAAFSAANDAYAKEVSYWNQRGGAKEPEYSRIQAQGAALKAQVQTLKAEQANVNVMIENVNALVVVINQVANNINLNAEAFNEIGKARGEEFEEGIYEVNGITKKIDIYEFTDSNKLIRVLTHELGHALGLRHVQNPKAIMYALNQGTSLSLTSADLTELTSHCRLK